MDVEWVSPEESKPADDDDRDFRRVVELAVAERRRQVRLKAEGRFLWTCADAEMSDFTRLAVLSEEVGEVARAVLEKGGLCSDRHNRLLLDELVQVAAVALAWAMAASREVGE